MPKPLVNKTYTLTKLPGSGWVCAIIEGVGHAKKKGSAWIRVKGSIDDVAISKFHLLPMQEGTFMLPVKNEIRRKIKKREGDTVHIKLQLDNDELEVPLEMMECLQDEPLALQFFNKLNDTERNYYIQWIYSAKKYDTKVNRLAKTIERLLEKKKFYHW